MAYIPRFDEETGIYRDCKWCQGKGCISCKIQADRDYKAEFPEGPQPIATFTRDAEGMKQFREFIDAITGETSEKKGDA